LSWDSCYFFKLRYDSKMSNIKVHACGRWIRVDYKATPEGYFTTYYDYKSNLQIMACPECGEMLSEEVLHDLEQEMELQRIFGKDFK
jgi:hypothetical protein